MYIYDHYGIKEKNGMEITYILNEKLKLSFMPHESAFWGEYFFAEAEGSGNYRLIPNLYNGEW